ncbi:hypothetical protein [Streptomyces sp. NPDC127084]|uniref:hypothetical protein n=1 Tax=Streptomyces sp. NPDC127084 TaxID=3347133 RepID=UPI00366048EF
MSFFGEGETLERWLSRSRALTVTSALCYVPAMGVLAVKEGRYWVFLLGLVLLSIAAYLGVRGYREIRPGMAFIGFLLCSFAMPLAVLAVVSPA